jgi:hypothetical protein
VRKGFHDVFPTPRSHAPAFPWLASAGFGRQAALNFTVCNPFLWYGVVHGGWQIAPQDQSRVKELAKVFLRAASRESLDTPASPGSPRRPVSVVLDGKVPVLEKYGAPPPTIVRERSREDLANRLELERRIAEGTSKRLISKWEREVRERQTRSMIVEADWTRPEVRGAYVRGHDFFGRVESEVDTAKSPQLPQPTQRGRRTSFDIPATQRNVASLVAQLTSTSQERLSPLSELADSDLTPTAGSARKESIQMDSFMTWDYSDDLGFGAAGTTLSEEISINASPRGTRRRRSSAYQVAGQPSLLGEEEEETAYVGSQTGTGYGPSDPAASEEQPGQATVVEADAGAGLDRRKRMGTPRKSAANRLRQMLSRTRSGSRKQGSNKPAAGPEASEEETKTEPSRRSRGSRRSRQAKESIPVPAPAQDDEAEVRPGTATLRAARRSILSQSRANPRMGGPSNGAGGSSESLPDLPRRQSADLVTLTPIGEQQELLPPEVRQIISELHGEASEPPSATSANGAPGNTTLGLKSPGGWSQQSRSSHEPSSPREMCFSLADVTAVDAATVQSPSLVPAEITARLESSYRHALRMGGGHDLPDSAPLVGATARDHTIVAQETDFHAQLASLHGESGTDDFWGQWGENAETQALAEASPFVTLRGKKGAKAAPGPQPGPAESLRPRRELECAVDAVLDAVDEISDFPLPARVPVDPMSSDANFFAQIKFVEAAAPAVDVSSQGSAPLNPVRLSNAARVVAEEVGGRAGPTLDSQTTLVTVAREDTALQATRPEHRLG